MYFTKSLKIKILGRQFKHFVLIQIYYSAELKFLSTHLLLYVTTRNNIFIQNI